MSEETTSETSMFSSNSDQEDIYYDGNGPLNTYASTARDNIATLFPVDAQNVSHYGEFTEYVETNFPDFELSTYDIELGLYFLNPTEAVNIIKENFPISQTIFPNRYTYRDACTNNLITKHFNAAWLARNPWPKPYIREPRKLGEVKALNSIMLPSKDQGIVQFDFYLTVFRSRPSHFIYCSEAEIPWCGVDLPFSTFTSPIHCFRLLDMLFEEIIAPKNIPLPLLESTDGSLTSWIQMTVKKPKEIDQRVLNTLTFTTDIIRHPGTKSIRNFLVTMALYWSSWLEWRTKLHHTQEYFQLIDDVPEHGHVSSIKLFIVRNKLAATQTLGHDDKGDSIHEESSPAQQSENTENIEGMTIGCRGYFGNKYISQRLRRYIIDPESNYNNCFFYCMFIGLKMETSNFEETAIYYRKLMNIPDGSKIKVSELDAICKNLKVAINLYRIYKDFNDQKFFEFHSGYGDPKEQTLNVLLKSSHFCLIQNVKKLLEFKSCNSCFDWFNSTTVKGMNHFAKCEKCEKCGRKVTENHLCRNKPEKRKKVRYDGKPSQKKFQGIKGFFSADFETFQDDEEQKVYAAGLGSMEDIEKDPGDAKITMWYGTLALDEFMKHLLEYRKKITVVFYNGSRFDFWFILRWLLAHRIKITKFVRDHKSNKLMNMEFANVKLWDLCLFTSTSLSALCDGYNIDRRFVKKDFDHSKIKSWADVKKYEKEVMEYLMFDVVALGLCHITFVKKAWELYQQPASKCMTLSQYAYDVWRNRFIEPENLSFIKIPTLGEWLFLRGALYGGRTSPYYKAFKSNMYMPYKFLKLLSPESQTQLFNVTNDYLVYLDVVSLYPYVSRQPMPIGNPRFRDDLDIIERILMKEVKNPYETELVKKGFYEVDVTCPRNIYIAFLFARDGKGGLIADLNDKIKQVYDGFTLLEAFKLGYKVTKVHAWLYFPRLGVVLESYMCNAFENKAKHTKEQPEYHIHKSMMNDLTGKFSQTPIDCKQYFFADDAFMANEKELGKFRRIEWMKDDKGDHLAYYVESEVDEVQITKSSQLGVFILSTSRVLMSEYTRQFNGYHCAENCPYYCDTDSLIIHNKVYEKNRKKPIFGKEWGQLKNELGEQCKIVAAYFPAPKTYALEYWSLGEDGKIIVSWYIRAKGIPKGNASCKTAQHYEELVQTLKDRPEELREALFSLYTRDGFKIETKNTLPFNYFYEMVVHDCYVVAHFGGLKKYLLDEQNLGCSVKLNLDLHRSINRQQWWKNGKRIIPTDNIWDISVPAGHTEVI